MHLFPYVRMVMDLSTPVNAAASISKDGKNDNGYFEEYKAKNSEEYNLYGFFYC